MLFEKTSSPWREPAFTFTNKKRYPGGQLEVFVDVKGGVIQNAQINGDFLALRPVGELEDALIGVQLMEGPLAEAIKQVDTDHILGSLGTEELLDVLLSSET
jgi:lipoate-protein ligase A